MSESNMNRRDFFAKLAAAGLVLSVPAVASAQRKVTDIRKPVDTGRLTRRTPANSLIYPKALSARNHLVSTTAGLAKKFTAPGIKGLKIADPRKATPFGIVSPVAVDKRIKSKMNRSSVFVETAALAVDDDRAVKSAKSLLANKGVPKDIIDDMGFNYVYGSVRDVTARDRGATILSKQYRSLGAQSMLMGIQQDGSTMMITAIMGSIVKILPILFKGEEEDEPAGNTSAEPAPAEMPEKAPDLVVFQECTLNCLQIVGPYMFPIAAAMCGPCIAALSAAVATGGALGKVAAIACGACAAAVAAPIVACLVLCGLEQLE